MSVVLAIVFIAVARMCRLRHGQELPVFDHFRFAARSVILRNEEAIDTVVGGTQLAAAIALLAKRGMALLLSAVAGFGMLIWIFVELAMIQQYFWLQGAYFILGGLELILVFVLLGIVPAFVNPLRESHAIHSTGSTIRD